MQQLERLRQLPSCSATAAKCGHSRSGHNEENFYKAAMFMFYFPQTNKKESETKVAYFSKI
jgi:hypothetical protein